MDDDRIEELFSGLGSVRIKRMFGGKGIYHGGVIFALVLRDELMLKGDAESAALLEAEGCRQWTYTGSRHGKLVLMPYWSAPDAALDDPDEMTAWARRAYEAALRLTRSETEPKKPAKTRPKKV